ncbi:tricarballylate dehydrogenase, partial [Staphylococcus succinus]
YNTEDFYKDILKVTNGESNPELAKFLSNESFETILWMKKQGVKFQLNENQYFEINGNKNFWGGLPIKTVDKGIGLMNALFKKAQELGIDIIYNAEVNKIEMDHNKVSAVNYLDNNKQRITVNTETIILACGSFEASIDKRVKYLGEEWEKAIVRGTEYNTGDGIEIATEIGANKAGHYDGCHAHTTDYNAPKVGDFSKPGDIYKKSSYPLGLIINKNGKRFVDEGADFRNYTYAKYGKETLRQPDQKAFQIYDSQVSPMLRKEYNLKEATKIVANTLEELAIKMDINPNDFVEMINEYNSSVQEGDYNPSVKDGKSTKGIIPEKTNWALKLDQAPYYAFPITCGITFAFGGISTNIKAEVLDEQNNPIAGLFVAGEMVGGLFYHNYPGGSGLMSGTVFGKRAGKSAAEYVQINKVDN